jgi:hypothetical protein
MYTDLRQPETEKVKPTVPDDQLALIRVWKDTTNGQTFYDCVCGRRKPLKNLKAIFQHTNKHAEKEQRTYHCPKCDRVFAHYLGLNSHQRTHKETVTLLPVIGSEEALNEEGSPSEQNPDVKASHVSSTFLANTESSTRAEST